MSGQTGQTFACPQCGKRFTWKPEFAGRKVSCGCGRVFEATLGFEGASMQGDGYDVVSDAPTRPIISASVMKASELSPTTRPDSIASAYPQRKRAKPVETDDGSNLDPEAANPLLHLYFPIVLLIVGAGAQLGRAIHMARGSVLGAAVLVLIDIHLAAAFTLGGAYVSALVLGVSFGSLSRASLKLAGIAVFCNAMAMLAASIDHDPNKIRGLVLGMHLSLLLYFALLYMMFDVDVQEALTAVVIIWVCQWVLAAGVYSVMGHFT